jgi:ankyrin repeat protein
MSKNSDIIDPFRALRTLAEDEFLSLPIDMNALDSERRCLLHQAITAKKWNVARALVERGIELNIADKGGFTPLHFAVLYAPIDVTKLILEHGGDPNITNSHGNGPLWAASRPPQVDYASIGLLIAFGADPHHKNKVGRSVLDSALGSSNLTLWTICGGNEHEFQKILSEQGSD